MKIGDALSGARGQIVWIVALAVSTAAIIHLERLDLGAPVSAAVGTAETTSTRENATLAFLAAEARMAAAPDDPAMAASLLLALSVAAQVGSLDLQHGRMRANEIAAKAATAGPEWQPVALLVDLTFAN